MGDEIKKLHSLIWLMQREIKDVIYAKKNSEDYILSEFMEELMKLSFGEIISRDFRREAEEISEEGWSKRESEEANRDLNECYEYSKKKPRRGEE